MLPRNYHFDDIYLYIQIGYVLGWKLFFFSGRVYNCEDDGFQADRMLKFDKRILKQQISAIAAIHSINKTGKIIL
jgi:hypothetical protein